MKNIVSLVLVWVACTGYAQQTHTTENQSESVRDLPNRVQQIDVDGRNMIRMYPNPTSGGITIEGFVVNAKSMYRICDATGRVVMQGNLREGKTPIDVSALLNGMYLVTITGEHETTTLRLVRQ